MEQRGYPSNAGMINFEFYGSVSSKSNNYVFNMSWNIYFLPLKHSILCFLFSFFTSVDKTKVGGSAQEHPRRGNDTE
jgi:hypothetical protein